jgi:hypothetical protein
VSCLEDYLKNISHVQVLSSKAADAAQLVVASFPEMNYC